MTSPKSVAEIESFIGMLGAACENPAINERLSKLLEMPDERRQAVVHAWVSDLIIAKAPAHFIQAIACLMDDEVAETAYMAIFNCERKR